jgi:CRISPR-associated protein (TIGR03986 family)
MRTVTPLIVLDAARAKEKPPGHKIFSVRMVGGQVYIPPTSIKGMLRAAYEAITNSRFGVFPEGAHDQRLGYRREARSALRLVPARIERSASGSWQVRLLFGLVDPATDVESDGRPKGQRPLMYAAWLPRYQKYTHPEAPYAEDKGEKRHALRYHQGGELPKHGDRVFVTVDRRLHRSGRFYYLAVTKIRPYDGRKQNGEHPGWVCITGRNAMQKYNERVFLDTDKAVVVTLLPHEWKSLEQEWDALLESYKTANEKVLEERRQLPNGPLAPDRYLGHEPGQMGLSHHIWDPHYQTLGDGTLCYAEVERVGKTFRVHHLYPVTISRALYRKTSWALLHPSLRPAASLDELSPADRLFGWVSQIWRGEGHEVAWRGCVRVGPVVCTSPDPVQDFPEPGLPLAILGQPKPQQYRFYVARDAQGNPFPDGDAGGIGYEEGQGLRGRKVYPHHAGLPKGYWDDPDPQHLKVGKRYREYLRPESERDSQNRSILGWVKPGAEFRFDINVENLSAVELGALLYLLSLPDGYYHRFGGGKPLGFGSVRLGIIESDVRTGKDWRKYYLSLSEEQQQDDQQAIRQKCIEAFKEAVEAQYHITFEKVSFIAAFLTAARGFNDGKPIHYPRVESQRAPDSKGEGFKWFQSNNKKHRLSLPLLTRDDGLPYLPDP